MHPGRTSGCSGFCQNLRPLSLPFLIRTHSQAGSAKNLKISIFFPGGVPAVQPPNHHQPRGATGKGICLKRGDNSQDYPLVSNDDDDDGDYNDSVIFDNER